jgi:hypothetical protein
MRHAFAKVVGTLLLVTASAPASADEPAAPPAPATDAPTAPTAPPASDAPSTPPDAEDPTVAAAREIAKEGLALFDAGKHEDALDRFERAGALVRAPTMGLMAARSLEKLGRLVEASERYLEVTRMTLDAGASDAFRSAQQDAAAERAALVPRIPSLLLALTPAAPGATVTLDGKPVAASRLGAAIPLDPGPHTVTATSGSVTRTERVLLRERDARRVELSLAPPPAPGPSSLAVASWIGIGVGGAGIVMGAVTGGLAVSKKSDLDRAGCADALCPEGVAGAVREYNTLVVVANVGLIGGITLAGAGALGLGIPALTSKRAPASSAASRPAGAPSRPALAWSPWIGPGSAGATWSF